MLLSLIIRSLFIIQINIHKIPFELLAKLHIPEII